MQRGVALPPFDLTDVAPMQGGVFGQLFLALAELETSARTRSPNCRVAAEIGSLAMEPTYHVSSRCIQRLCISSRFVS